MIILQFFHDNTAFHVQYESWISASTKDFVLVRKDFWFLELE